jgi:hypothetical protein
VPRYTKGRQFIPARPPRKQTFSSDFTEEERAQAWRAIQVLNGMLPQLKHFARSATGNPRVEVKVDVVTPHTKGNVITIRPPLGLGNVYSHDRSKCGSREYDGKQICEACRVREVIEFYLFHEIAHVAFGTQESCNKRDYRHAEKYIAEWHPDGVCSHQHKIREDMTLAPDPLNLGKVLNPFLPMILNCFEDTRVNARTFDGRPGFRTVFDVNIKQLIEVGSEVGVDKYVHWSEAPLDSQFMVGLYFKSAGFEVDRHLAPVVVEALNDNVVTDLCMQAINATDVHAIFKLSLEVFKRAQVLGFCVVPKCELPPPALPSDLGDSSDSGSDGPNDNSAEREPGSDGGESESDEASPDSPAEDDQPENPTDGSESGGSGTDPEGDQREDGDSPESEDSGGDDQEGDDSADEAESDGGSGQDQEEDGDTGSSGGSGQEDHEDDSGDDLSDSPSSDWPGDEDFDDDSADDFDSGGSDGSSENGHDEREQVAGDEPDESGTGEPSDGSSEGTPGSNPDLDPSNDWMEDDPVYRDFLAGNDITQDVDEDSDDVDEDVDEDGDVDEDEYERTDDADENPWDTEGPDDTGGTPNEAPSMPANDPTGADLEHGTPEDAERAISKFLMHGNESDDQGLLEQMADGNLQELTNDGEELPEYVKNLIRVALSQHVYFDSVSRNVAGIEEVPFPHVRIGWEKYYKPDDFAPEEALLGKTVLHARRVFDDNERAKNLTNLKSGRINTRALGRRAPLGDPRLFHKRVLPGKRSYFVVIGADCSGSTNSYDRIGKIKRIVRAQCDVLARLGIPFAGYGHTAYTAAVKSFGKSFGSDDTYYVYMLPFKKVNEPWNDEAKIKLANIMPVSDNLDGHTLEFYRKEAERSQATDKIIIYTTDGEMPAANYYEEVDILEREVKLCERKGITLLGVGINTNSPVRWGMDTVRVDSDEDIRLVMEQLDRRLTR